MARSIHGLGRKLEEYYRAQGDQEHLEQQQEANRRVQESRHPQPPRDTIAPAAPAESPPDFAAPQPPAPAPKAPPPRSKTDGAKKDS